MTIINYLMEYQQILIYLIVLSCCFVFSIFGDKDHKQSLSLAIICIAYVTSPILRELLQDSGILSESKGFFEYYTYYNLMLAVLLCTFNYGEKRGLPLYIIYMLAASLNWWCYQQWGCKVKENYPVTCYTIFIYENYQFINKILMDHVVLAAVALKNKKRLLLVSVVLIAIPYIHT